VANLLTVAEAITLSALERQESRGGHFREDYPAKVAEFGTVNVMVKQSAHGEMQVSRVPLPPIPPELQQAIEEQKQ
jgi:succinate dehydrogenase / fumarate reductase flavoprotein subunit